MTEHLVEAVLPLRRPLHPDNLFGHLAATAVPGVEEWRDGAFRAAVRLPGGPAVLSVRPPVPGSDRLPVRLALADPGDEAEAVRRCRLLLDLDVDPGRMAAVLGADPALAPLVAAAPGRRVPGAVDAEAFAIRTVLGQQVSTAAARTHAARLVRSLGEPLEDPGGGLTHLFPDPSVMAAMDPDELALPRARRATLVGLAAALAQGRVRLDAADLPATRRDLLALPGIGPWTVEILAMRGLGDPDAFPAGDLGLRAAAERLGLPGRARDLEQHAERWRPYRSHAVQYLWSVLDHPVNVMPG